MTWLLVGGGLVLFGGGMVTGLSLQRDQTARVVERQTELIGELQDGQRALVEAAARPVVLDAELRASLASTPVQSGRATRAGWSAPSSPAGSSRPSTRRTSRRRRRARASGRYCRRVTT